MQSFIPDSWAQAPKTGAIQVPVAILLLLVSFFGAGCAKIAEPRPPEVRIPKPAVDLAARQISDYVSLSVSKPEANTNGSRPVVLKSIELYRLAEQPNSQGELPEHEFLKRAIRILSISAPRFSEHLSDGLFVFQDRFALNKQEMYSHTYRYAVLFVNHRNQSAGLSNQASLTPVPIPPPPAGITAEGTQNSVRLKWTAPTENMDGTQPPRYAGFNIYRSEEPNHFPAKPINSAPITATEFEDSDFRFDATYYYAVTTVGNVQQPCPESVHSPALPFTTKDVFPPAPPTDFNALFQENVVFLYWAASASTDVAGYRLYRREKGEQNHHRIQSELIRGLSLRDGTIEAGKPYEYEIEAVDTHGNSSPLVKTDLEYP